MWPRSTRKEQIVTPFFSALKLQINTLADVSCLSSFAETLPDQSARLQMFNLEGGMDDRPLRRRMGEETLVYGVSERSTGTLGLKFRLSQIESK